MNFFITLINSLIGIMELIDKHLHIIINKYFFMNKEYQVIIFLVKVILVI